MSTDTQTSWSTGAKKKGVLLVAACLILAVFGTAYFVCTLQYDRSRDRLLAGQKDALEAWLSGTAEAVTLWTAELDTQAKRVSSSELYQLFAADVERLGGNAAAVINDDEATAKARSEAGADDEDLASLAEQVPLMRNLLLDFMNFSGLSDARIVNAKGQTLLSALARPTPITDMQQETVAAAVKSGKVAFAPVRAAQTGLVLDFAEPLGQTVSGESGEKPVAALLLSTPVTAQIARFLARDMRQTESARPRLVQQRSGGLEELRVESAGPDALDAARLPLDGQGNMPFGRRPALDGQGAVYSVGMRIPGLNWWIVLEEPASEVDGRLRSQAWMIYGIGGLISLGVVLLLALLWWIVIGREQRAVAERFQALYSVIKRQKQLLDSVNVSLEVGLLMVAPDGRIQVCNRAFAEIAGKEETELPGMSLTALFSMDVCGRLLDAIRRVVESRNTMSVEISHPPAPGAGGERLYRVTLYPFMDNEGDSDGVVATFQDITRFRRESERRRLQQVNTIAALTQAIESVDPYLKGHSRMMADIADLIGRQMGLADKDRDTIRTAASLSQTGKLFVPRDLLAKTGQLSEEEQAEIRHAPDYAYNVLRDIDFGSPVAEAVHEMSERVDGTGYPQGLSGEEISIHARVLAVVNAFCAMVSPRSFRSGMPVSQALERLREDKASFDPGVVDALDAVLRTPEGLRLASPLRPQED